MKYIILLLILFSGTLFYAQENNSKIAWETDFEKAKTLAKKEQKTILMLFSGSDWSIPCKMLKEDFFNSDKFAERSKDFIMLMVDFPKNRELISLDQKNANKKLNLTYNVGSLPTLIAINYRGDVLSRIKSYNAVRDTHKHFEFIDKL